MDNRLRGILLDSVYLPWDNQLGAAYPWAEEHGWTEVEYARQSGIIDNIQNIAQAHYSLAAELVNAHR